MVSGNIWTCIALLFFMYYFFDCSHLVHIRQRFCSLYSDAGSCSLCIISLTAAILFTFVSGFVRCIAMLVSCGRLSGIKSKRLCVVALLPSFLIRQMTLAWTCPHKPMLAEWTS